MESEVTPWYILSYIHEVSEQTLVVKKTGMQELSLFFKIK